ncbi:MAG: SpoIIE family protein phosphatase [Odoribacteraceae bacterium]|jgi:sigma-B regulation protein RsbU (phosphoserine phosphatase)|nr:SpoIIE family protein phosphatase [Odoribacteraceae bacterium]
MKRAKNLFSTRLALAIFLSCSAILLLLFVVIHLFQRVSLLRQPDHAYEPVALVGDIVLVSCLCCLVLLFRVTHRVIKRIFLPLEQLAATTRTIADGHFNEQLPMNDSHDELQELRDSFRYMQQKIVDSMGDLKSSTIEKEKIQSEMRVAQRIQERFLPVQHILHDRRFSLYAALEQSKSVGGDMYSYFVKKSNLYILVGDVQGNGIPAALYMASISTLFNYVAPTKHATSEICNTLNTYMCRNTGDDIFITLFIGILNLNSGILNYTNAGHPYPIIRRGDKGEAIFLKEPLDMPIGVTDNEYMEDHIQLEKGDLILIYTDGVTESQNKAKQFYGKDRLLHLVKESPNSTPEEVVTAVLADVKNHSGETTESDDLALVSILFHDAVFY